MKPIQFLIAAAIILATQQLYAQNYISATGGTVTTVGNYKIHTFTSSGTFTITSIGTDATYGSVVEYLVVGGGGGGSAGIINSNAGAGGGAGGFLSGTGFSVSATSYSITVGNGGVPDSSGNNSIFSTLTAIGGGAGGRITTYDGGSGGGNIYVASTGGSGIIGQGHDGRGGNGIGGPNYPSGGGGGAGSIGGLATGYIAGNGGDGVLNSITGTSTYYAGGGGGGTYYGSSPGTGGSGIGGNGGLPNQTGFDGTANTGSGGGGGGGMNTNLGGAGGSGIVIIKYQFQGTGGTGSGTSSGLWTQASNNPNNIFNNNTGSVGIGTQNINDVNYKLFVETGIRTRKLKVDAPSLTWPDYVFDKNYKLPTLAEIEKYIKANNHLSEIPSAKNVEQNGVDVGYNQALLLKKIEELTLILIGQQKQIDLIKKTTSKKNTMSRKLINEARKQSN